jgi:hypothetical protein
MIGSSVFQLQSVFTDNKGLDMNALQIGDKVAYSVQFLRSIGCFYGDMPAAQGTIIELRSWGETTLARIDWNIDCPKLVNVVNLTRVGPNSRFYAVD